MKRSEIEMLLYDVDDFKRRCKSCSVHLDVMLVNLASLEKKSEDYFDKQRLSDAYDATEKTLKDVKRLYRRIKIVYERLMQKLNETVVQ